MTKEEFQEKKKILKEMSDNIKSTIVIIKEEGHTYSEEELAPLMKSLDDLKNKIQNKLEEKK